MVQGMHRLLAPAEPVQDEAEVAGIARVVRTDRSGAPIVRQLLPFRVLRQRFGLAGVPRCGRWRGHGQPMGECRGVELPVKQIEHETRQQAGFAQQGSGGMAAEGHGDGVDGKIPRDQRHMATVEIVWIVDRPDLDRAIRHVVDLIATEANRRHELVPAVLERHLAGIDRVLRRDRDGPCRTEFGREVDRGIAPMLSP